MQTTKINCPKCGNEFNVEDVLSHRIEEKYRQELSGKIAELEKSFVAKENAVQQRELELKKQAEDMERQIAIKAKAASDAKAAELKAQIETQTAEKYETQLKSLAEADAESKKKITELKNTQIENERLKRQLDDQKQDMQLEFEKTLSDRLKEQSLVIQQRELELKMQAEDMERQIAVKVKAAADAKAAELKAQIETQTAEKYETQLKSLAEADAESKKKITELKNTQIENERLKRQLDEKEQDLKLKFEREKSEFVKEQTLVIQQREKESAELVIQELKKQLDDQKKLADEMKRKAEQGSTQMQGEIQEIALEKMLRELYEIEGDTIEEVKKGQRGADVVHVVRTRQGDICGKICYESKRTKKFDEGWLQKLRDDNLDVKADVLVIVTEAMPPGQERFFCKEGVWICSFWEVKGLSTVLRYAIMQAHTVSVVQQGKETKMEMIYDFLTGNEFAGQFGAILEGFKALQDNYATEKLRMEKIWKEREKQLEKVLTNAARFYGSIKGIAGQSIPNIKMLEEDTMPLLEG